MGARIDNMGKMMNNPQQRNIYFMLIGVAVLSLGVGVYYANKNSGPKPTSGAAIISAPAINTTPGSSDNPQYNKNIKDANANAVADALAKDKSFVPTLVNDKSISDKSIIDQIDRDKRIKEEAAQKEAAQKEEEIKQIEIAKVDAQKVNVQQVTTVSTVTTTPVVKHNKYGYDDASVIAYLVNNNRNKSSNAEFNFAKNLASDKNIGTKDSQNTAQSNNVNNSVENSVANTKDDISTYAKAGTIFNAVLETGINSDEPSPVLAKIVSGDLKGTRLIGQIQTVGEKVLIQFSTANIPKLNNSVAISAYAVNPNTSRTALADNVNHHYFLKYGVLLASSFLSGFADAISHQNTTTTLSPLGGATVTQGELSSRDINRAALGTVGKSFAGEGQKFQSLQPTITVESGSAIGILLIDDFKVKN